MNQKTNDYTRGYQEGWQFALNVLEKAFNQYFSEVRDQSDRRVLRAAHKELSKQILFTESLLIPEINKHNEKGIQ